MMTPVLHCPPCQGTDRVRQGKTPLGKPRYRCRETSGQGGTFRLDDSYPGQSPHINEQSVAMAMHASGIRDTARLLHISPTTVSKELKKRHLRSTT